MATEPPVVKNTSEARQGQNAGVRIVLIASLILIVVAFAVVWLTMLRS